MRNGPVFCSISLPARPCPLPPAVSTSYYPVASPGRSTSGRRRNYLASPVYRSSERGREVMRARRDAGSCCCCWRACMHTCSQLLPLCVLFCPALYASATVAVCTENRCDHSRASRPKRSPSRAVDIIIIGRTTSNNPALHFLFRHFLSLVRAISFLSVAVSTIERTLFLKRVFSFTRRSTDIVLYCIV